MDAWKEMKFADDPRVSSMFRRTSSLARQHIPFIAFLAIASFIVLCTRLPWPQSDYNKLSLSKNGTQVFLPNTTMSEGPPKFAKVAVASGFEDIVYEKALETHWKHAERHGYPMYLARENAADGMYNKIAYMITVMSNELYKLADERVEWIFYFDADSIIMNQQIPLEIFIPPSDYPNVNYMAGRDYNGLNAGVLILRVCSWSLDLLYRTMTYKHYHPDENYVFEEQHVLAELTEKDEEFKAQSVYVPRSWFNAYFYSLDEVKPGLLLSHFPHPDYKWHIYEWLKVLEADKDEAYKPVYNKPVQDTDYPAEIKLFWNVNRRVEKTIKGFERNVNRGADPIQFGLQHEETKKLAEEFRDKFDELKTGAKFKTEDPVGLNKLIDEAEEANAKLIQELMAYFETHDNPPPVAGF